MPRYEYRCVGCGVVFDDILPMKNRNDPCSEVCKKCGGEIKIGIGSIRIGDPVRLGLMKPTGAFRDVMKMVNKTNKHNMLNM